MGVVLKRYSTKAARGKAVRHTVEQTFGTEKAFNQPYVRELHRRGFVSTLRYWTKPKGQRSTLTGPGRRHVAMVRKCVMENRPFLAGFFADEPTWRPRLLKWADKVLRTPQDLA